MQPLCKTESPKDLHYSDQVKTFFTNTSWFNRIYFRNTILPFLSSYSLFNLAHKLAYFLSQFLYRFLKPHFGKTILLLTYFLSKINQ